MSTYYYYGDTLYHHGIKGQKWGIRKYQNEDGSLTAAGREHYGYGSAKGTAYRVASKIYGLNERTYNKLGNKTLASMNKSAKNEMLKKAAEADRKASEKRTAAGREHYGYGEVKAAYKKRLSDADSSWKSKSDNLEKEYFRRLEDIEKNYKRGQMLSEKDQKRESELDDWWDKEQKKLNANRDSEKKNAKSDFKNSDEYKARQEKIKKAAIAGAAVAATALAAYGAYKIGSDVIKQKKWDKAKAYGQKYYKDLADRNFRNMEANIKTKNREYDAAKKIYRNIGLVPTNTKTYQNITKAENDYMNSYRAATGAYSRAGYYGSGTSASLSNYMKKNSRFKK